MDRFLSSARARTWIACTALIALVAVGGIALLHRGEKEPARSTPAAARPLKAEAAEAGDEVHPQGKDCGQKGDADAEQEEAAEESFGASHLRSGAKQLASDHADAHAKQGPRGSIRGKPPVATGKKSEMPPTVHGEDPCLVPTTGIGTGWTPSDGDLAVSATHYVSVVNNALSYGPRLNYGPPSATLRAFSDIFGVPDTAFYDPHVEWTPRTNGSTTGPGTFFVVAGQIGGNQIWVANIAGNNPGGTWSVFHYTPASGDKFDFSVTNDKIMIKSMSYCCGGTVGIDVFNLARRLNNEFSGNVDALGTPYRQRVVVENAPGMMAAKVHGNASDLNDGYLLATVGTSVVSYKVTGLPGSVAIGPQTVLGSDPRISGDNNVAVPGGTIDTVTGPQIESAGIVKNTSGQYELFGAIPTGCQTDKACSVTPRYNLTTNTFSTLEWSIPGADVICAASMLSPDGVFYISYSYASPTQLPTAASWSYGYNNYQIGYPDGATSLAPGSNVRWGDYFGMDLWGTQVHGMATSVSGGGANAGPFNWQAHYFAREKWSVWQ